MKNSCLCLCQSGKAYQNCCEPLHRGNAHADTALALMRSRYSAYALGNNDYVLATWHASTRPSSLEDDATQAKWFSLKILSQSQGQPGDPHGQVEFLAKCRINGKAHRLREVSQFVWEDGQWFYLGGQVDSE